MCLVSNSRDLDERYPPVRKAVIAERVSGDIGPRGSFVSTASRRRVVEVDRASSTGGSRRSSRRVIEVEEPISTTSRRSSRVIMDDGTRSSGTRVVVEQPNGRRKSKVKHIYYSPNSSAAVLAARGTETVVVRK